MNDFARVLAALEQGGSAVLEIPTEGGTVRRRFDAEERLILLGGGHVSCALAAFAAQLGYAVSVVDDRASFVTRERFPDARERICSSYAGAIEALSVRAGDSVCILTRGHRWDREALRALLTGTEPGYLGMIGSHRRVAGLFASLAEEGYDRERLARVHAPIGLPIGAVTPQEIAVSICAELIAHRRAARAGDDTLPQTNTDMAMLRFLAAPERPCAYALVLDATGSTPVKGGAMMSLDCEGRALGTVGGGCGEAAVMRRARTLIGTGKSDVITIDLSADAAAEDGLVCGGTMRVLIRDLPLTQGEERAR